MDMDPDKALSSLVLLALGRSEWWRFMRKIRYERWILRSRVDELFFSFSFSFSFSSVAPFPLRRSDM
jgi:hypothetical protein